MSPTPGFPKANSKPQRDPAMYEFEEPTTGYLGRGHLVFLGLGPAGHPSIRLTGCCRVPLRKFRLRSPHTKTDTIRKCVSDGTSVIEMARLTSDTCIGTTIQRVGWLNKELRMAHEEIDDLRKIQAKLEGRETDLENEVEKISSLNKLQKEMISEFEKDKPKLEKHIAKLESQINMDARAEDLKSQLETERMSSRAVQQLEQKLALMEIQRETISRELAVEKTNHAATRSALIDDKEQAMARLVDQNNQTIAALTRDHDNERKVLALRKNNEIQQLTAQVTLEQQKCRHLEEIGRFKDQQGPEVQYTYRGGAGREGASHEAESRSPRAEPSSFRRAIESSGI